MQHATFLPRLQQLLILLAANRNHQAATLTELARKQGGISGAAAVIRNGVIRRCVGES